MKNSWIRQYPLNRLEKITALFSVAFGIWMKWYLSTRNWTHNAKSVINNPAFYPTIVAYGFIVVGVLLFLYSLQTDKKEMRSINWLGLTVVALWLVYSALCSTLGFVLASILALTATFFLWGGKNKRIILVASLAAPAVLYLCLGVLMGVRFPTLFL